MAASLDRRPSGELPPGDTSSWRRSNSQLRDTEVVENYQIGQIIGRGGFATVHKCINVLTAEVVAAKKFEGVKFSKSNISEIMTEADLLKGLQHPNVVRFIEVVKKKETLYLFTEYVEGGSLTSLIEEFGCVPESMCVVYVPQILAGLAYLHERGIIHRDIKGSNILLTKGGQIKLTDFGVSAILNDVEKRFSVVGTPYWIAPEVIKLEGWKDVSDVWSLGCTIVELLQGGPPYFDLYPMAAMYKIVEDQMPVPEDGLSQELKDFLHACFAKPASTRPSASRLLAHPWVTKHSAVQEPTDISTMRSQLKEMTIRIEAAEASKLKEKLNEQAQAYAKQRRSAKGMNYIRAKAGSTGALKNVPTKATDAAPPSRPSPAPSPARERGSSVSHSQSSDRLSSAGRSDKDKDREREREKEHKEKDHLSRSKSRDFEREKDDKDAIKRTAQSAKNVDYRRSLPPGAIAPVSPPASPSASNSPVRRSTKASGSHVSDRERSDKDRSDKDKLERPPSRPTSSSDSSARERLAESKVEKYRVLVDEAKSDAARSRTKLEEAEREIKALKRTLEDTNQRFAQLTAENSALSAKVRALEAQPPPPPPRDQPQKTFTPPAAEGPSRSETWGNTKDLNASIQALQEQLKANEEKAKQLAVAAQKASSK